MLQNKLLFNQSAVSLEIFGLPDLANNENNEQISIISQWKLKIIDMPLIEGNVDHLSLIMEAFYSYSNFLINNETPLYESKLININADNHFTHNIILKSSKPDVKPLNIKIGNSVLSDIINCFDQLNSSNKVRNLKSNKLNFISKKRYFNPLSQKNIFNIIIHPLLSLVSLLIVSGPFIYFYSDGEYKEESKLINSEFIINSIKSPVTII